MKLQPPPGVLTDLAPTSAQEFWYSSDNVRFRAGRPETIGLEARVQFLPPIEENALLPLDGSAVTLYPINTHSVLVGSGREIGRIIFEDGPLVLGVSYSIENALPLGSDTVNRWWFTEGDNIVIAARSDREGTVYAYSPVFNEEGGPPAVQTEPFELPNAPDGATAGGVVGGILILAGCRPLTGGVPPSRRTVRWSARTTDPAASGGEVGFEDWIPTDINSSSEVLLPESTIIGGGGTAFGFLVWTDKALWRFRPRQDIYVFTQEKVPAPGLFSSGCWIETGGRVWWMDSDRVLNVFDGGASRPILNTLRRASVEQMDDNEFERCYFAANPENFEVICCYPGSDGFMRQIVYNWMEDCWYPWSRNWAAFIPSQNWRPSLAVDVGNGQLLNCSLREQVDPRFLDLMRGFFDGGSLDPPDPPSAPALEHVVPHSFHLMTNLVSPGNAAMQSLKSRNAVISYKSARPVPGDDVKDTIRVTTRSFRQDISHPPTIDYDDLIDGETTAELRAGGRYVQYAVSGSDVTSMFTFGEIDLDAGPGGKK